MKATLSLLYGSALWATLLLTGCTKDETIEDPYLTIDQPEGITLEAGKTSTTITITTNQPSWNFALEEGQEWCSASKGQKQHTDHHSRL
ncbi:hypothetical protein [Millionella massiliensis]|uniref:hypothetical protein n=1 Tax=Millionella massiliensis TaxID=1871023 RepID=UPI0024B641D9|nr:hypothetical protein [Millionella massiliensis]